MKVISWRLMVPDHARSDRTEVDLCQKSYHVQSRLPWCNEKSADATHDLDSSDVRKQIKYNEKIYILTGSHPASDVMQFLETMVKGRTGFGWDVLEPNSGFSVAGYSEVDLLFPDVACL